MLNPRFGWYELEGPNSLRHDGTCCKLCISVYRDEDLGDDDYAWVYVVSVYTPHDRRIGHAWWQGKYDPPRDKLAVPVKLFPWANHIVTNWLLELRQRRAQRQRKKNAAARERGRALKKKHPGPQSRGLDLDDHGT